MIDNKPLRPMISFFGSKWRIAKLYPAPAHDTIIEPFAGGATYSLHYYWKNIILNDIDPVIFGTWDYLIKAKPSEILSLPTQFEDVRELNIIQEAKWLIGWWLNKGCIAPRNIPSQWMRNGGNKGNSRDQYWSQKMRQRVADQSEKIKHWKITNDNYENISNDKATWFIDPPYHKSGKCYVFNEIDYLDLAIWSTDRTGQSIVCEQQGAEWLPFQHLVRTQATQGRGGKISHEVIFTSSN